MNSKFTKIIRLLLGLILFVFGLNKLIPFIPQPNLPAEAIRFFRSLGDTGYFIPILAIIEMFVGALLLIKKWVPFALVILTPISINILLFHLFLDVNGIFGAVLVFVFNTILIYKYRKAYTTLFT